MNLFMRVICGYSGVHLRKAFTAFEIRMAPYLKWIYLEISYNVRGIHSAEHMRMTKVVGRNSWGLEHCLLVASYDEGEHNWKGYA